MRRAPLLLLPLALALTGCAISARDEAIKTLLDTHLLDLLAEGIKFALLGGLIGVILAAASLSLLARAGAYRWEWKHAVWLRGLNYVASFVLLVGLTGAIGLFEGALRGAVIVITQSQIGKDVLPMLGGGVADVIAQIHIVHTTKKNGKDPEVRATILAFEAGTWELDCAGAIESISALEAHVWRGLSDESVSRVVKALPVIHQRMGEAMLRWVFEAIGRALVRSTIEGKAQDVGIELRASRLADALLAEAAAHGDPKTITHAEVSRVIVRDLLVPSILSPLRRLIRAQQLALALGIFATLVVPILLFRLAERLRSRRTPPADDRPALEKEVPPPPAP